MCFTVTSGYHGFGDPLEKLRHPEHNAIRALLFAIY